MNLITCDVIRCQSNYALVFSSFARMWFLRLNVTFLQWIDKLRGLVGL